MTTTTKTLGQRLPYGAGREIERRLAQVGGESVRSLSHISRVLSGDRDDVVVEDVARELLREKWKRTR